MKSGRFHGKDLYICIGSDEKYSILVVDHEFHGKDLYTACIYLYSDEKYSILVVFHEFHVFHEVVFSFHLHFMKSGRFHGKDLYICIGSDEKYSFLVVDHEICRIS